MRNIFLPINFLFFVFVAGNLPAQKDSCRFQLSGAFTYSNINNREEVSLHFKPGFCGALNWQPSPWMYIQAQTTTYIKHDNWPFTGIRAWDAGGNVNILLAMQNNISLVRFFAGASYVHWEGTYVALTSKDPRFVTGAYIRQHWIAGDVGLGLSFKISSRIFLDTDVRFFISGENNSPVGISSTCYEIGLRYAPKKIGSHGQKTNSGIPGRHYHWLKKKHV